MEPRSSGVKLAPSLKELSESMSENIFSREVKTEYVEKKSRFLSQSYLVSNTEEFHNILNKLKNSHGKANHITYAYRIKDNGRMIVKFSDDGEPSGTAGKPILAHLEGQRIIDGVIFVIRYFGGVKLGAGGLVRAYSHSAGLAIKQSEPQVFIDYKTYTFAVPYEKQRQYEYHMNKVNYQSRKEEYGENIEVKISCTKEDYEILLEALAL